MSDSPPPKKSKLYTKKGDTGTTALFNNERKPKDDIIFECLGTLDELGAHLGLAREYCEQTKNGLSDHIAQVIIKEFTDSKKRFNPDC